ncbi:MAG: ABC transporter ATP-binding protein [Candidatus Bathyarchaeia archaeon]|nr:ABC transporter ATP-binding protein [Candidatus Bathyarchaeota archaeon]
MISVLGLCAQRGSFSLTDISFDVQDGKFLVIMGPNGCGKTTLLECIAGLHKISSGRIMVDGVDVTDLPAEKRRIGYVPADCALFPRMTVRQNILLAFRKSRGMRLEDLRKILHTLQIEDLMDRSVEQLSSGQKQRVAITRALAANPSALLMDEPCSALDPPTKETFKGWINGVLKEVFHEFDIPVIYTTHDILEASAVGDKIAIMNNGRVEQIGSVNEVFEEPRSKFIAEFLGYNVLNGRILSTNGKHISIKVGDVALTAEGYNNALGFSEEVVVIIRPCDIFLSPIRDVRSKWKGCHCNVLEGTLESLRIEGSIVKADVTVGNFSLRAEVSQDFLEDLRIGSRVFIHIKASRVKVLPKHMKAQQ